MPVMSTMATPFSNLKTSKPDPELLVPPKNGAQIIIERETQRTVLIFTTMNELFTFGIKMMLTYFALWFGYKIWKSSQKRKSKVIGKLSQKASKTEESTDRFSQAVAFIATQKQLGNDERLVAYALYKQVGCCYRSRDCLYSHISFKLKY
jgi:hypothetical protein